MCYMICVCVLLIRLNSDIRQASFSPGWCEELERRRPGTDKATVLGIVTIKPWDWGHNHSPPILQWFIPPIYGDFGDGLLLFYPHIYICTYLHIGSRVTCSRPINLFSFPHDRSLGCRQDRANTCGLPRLLTQKNDFPGKRYPEIHVVSIMFPHTSAILAGISYFQTDPWDHSWRTLNSLDIESCCFPGGSPFGVSHRRVFFSIHWFLWFSKSHHSPALLHCWVLGKEQWEDKRHCLQRKGQRQGIRQSNHRNMGMLWDGLVMVGPKMWNIRNCGNLNWTIIISSI